MEECMKALIEMYMQNYKSSATRYTKTQKFSIRIHINKTFWKFPFFFARFAVSSRHNKGYLKARKISINSIAMPRALPLSIPLPCPFIHPLQLAFSSLTPSKSLLLCSRNSPKTCSGFSGLSINSPPNQPLSRSILYSSQDNNHSPRPLLPSLIKEKKLPNASA